MDPAEKIIYESIITEYRQDVDALKWALARANGQGKVKDMAIEELSKKLDALAPAAPVPPKPGPAPAR